MGTRGWSRDTPSPLDPSLPTPQTSYLLCRAVMNRKSHQPKGHLSQPAPGMYPPLAKIITASGMPCREPVPTHLRAGESWGGGLENPMGTGPGRGAVEVLCHSTTSVPEAWGPTIMLMAIFRSSFPWQLWRPTVYSDTGGQAPTWTRTPWFCPWSLGSAGALSSGAHLALSTAATPPPCLHRKRIPSQHGLSL